MAQAQFDFPNGGGGVNSTMSKLMSHSFFARSSSCAILVGVTARQSLVKQT